LPRTSALARHAWPITLGAFEPVGGLVINQPSSDPSAQRELFDILERVIVAARDAYGARTLGQLLGHDLHAVATALGVADVLDVMDLRFVTQRPGACDELAAGIEELLGKISSKDRVVLRGRIAGDPMRTLDDVGRELGVTRERVRQRQRRLEGSLEKTVGRTLGLAAALLRLRLGPVISDEHFEPTIRHAFTDQGEATDLAVHIAMRHLDYTEVNGIRLAETSLGVVDILRVAAEGSADRVGLIDQEALKLELPSEEWRPYWPLLVRACGFYEVLGQLALRDTSKARVKAAVIRIGQPATREEIAKEAGMDPAKVGSQLSAIPSIARADMRRWGLVDWIEDVYEGIPAEIIQRIDEDGGATTMSRLIDELPRLFGVSESSVRAYVATPQFVHKGGYVSLADPSTIALRSLEDAVHGHDADGFPYWEFEVEQRHFDGYSVLGFPPEVARELGCEANGSERIPLTTPADCQPVSVVWRLSSTTGASLGYLAEPLQRIGAKPGDRVRVVVLGPRAAALTLPTRGSHNREDGGDRASEILAKMLDRKRAL